MSFVCLERLRIKTLPTLALVKDAKTRDYIVGFSDLGNTDEFSTEVPAFFYQLKLGGSGRISLAQNFQTPNSDSTQNWRLWNNFLSTLGFTQELTHPWGSNK